MFDLLMIPKLLAIKDRIASDLATGLSVHNIVSSITDSGILDLLESIGEQQFPKVAPEMRVIAAIATSFDTNGVKWVQNALNRLIVPSPALVVDGHTGPRTKAAVEQLQVQLGIQPDGWAGDITMAAIQFALVKLDASSLVTPTMAKPAPSTG